LICARNGNVVQIGDSGVHGVVHDDSCVVGLIDSGGYSRLIGVINLKLLLGDDGFILVIKLNVLFYLSQVQI